MIPLRDQRAVLETLKWAKFITADVAQQNTIMAAILIRNSKHIGTRSQLLSAASTNQSKVPTTITQAQSHLLSPLHLARRLLGSSKKTPHDVPRRNANKLPKTNLLGPQDRPLCNSLPALSKAPPLTTLHPISVFHRTVPPPNGTVTIPITAAKAPLCVLYQTSVPAVALLIATETRQRRTRRAHPGGHNIAMLTKR